MSSIYIVFTILSITYGDFMYDTSRTVKKEDND